MSDHRSSRPAHYATLGKGAYAVVQKRARRNVSKYDGKKGKTTTCRANYCIFPLCMC